MQSNTADSCFIRSFPWITSVYVAFQRFYTFIRLQFFLSASPFVRVCVCVSVPNQAFFFHRWLAFTFQNELYLSYVQLSFFFSRFACTKRWFFFSSFFLLFSSFTSVNDSWFTFPFFIAFSEKMLITNTEDTPSLCYAIYT